MVIFRAQYARWMSNTDSQIHIDTEMESELLIHWFEINWDKWQEALACLNAEFNEGMKIWSTWSYGKNMLKQLAGKKPRKNHGAFKLLVLPWKTIAGSRRRLSQSINRQDNTRTPKSRLKTSERRWIRGDIISLYKILNKEGGLRTWGLPVI